MKQALEARVKVTTPRLEINLYSDFALYLYLANFEPQKFRKTALYIDDPDNYHLTIEQYSEVFQNLGLRSKLEIYGRLKHLEEMFRVHGVFDGMKDYHSAALFFWKSYLVPRNNYFPNENLGQKTILKVIK